jgi:metallo-beta-lactamase family protein
MKITLYGAAGEVTGSAYLFHTDSRRVLVDFGLFQGGKTHEDRNRVYPECRTCKPDAVLLTHAHLDHVGRLPLLVKQGFRGVIHCTPATVEMTELILRDAVKVHLQDLEHTNRKRFRAGLPALTPRYTMADVEAVLGLLRPVAYETPVSVVPGVTARYLEAGHMLGSASIEVAVDEGGRTRTVLFSGDLGPRGTPILKDYRRVEKADAVFMESTYGGRDHKPLAETIDEFESIVDETVRRGGKLLVPVFAVGRTQLLLYLLAGMFRAGRVPKFPVYVDSPMAIEATKIYGKHPELYDEEAMRLLRQYPVQRDLSSVKLSVTADDSKALNELSGPLMIMAGAGMCNAGRILHHLKHNLCRPETSVVIVGFQAEGSLGRTLIEGAKKVKIFGETIAVKARIHTLGGFSAHAGQTDLLYWFESLAASRPRLVLTHGEPDSRKALAAAIEAKFGIAAALPAYGESIDLG